MEEYRAYMMGHDDHVTSRISICCSNREEARLLAKTCVDEYAVELWQADHFLERFEPRLQRMTG
jgi:putative hemolysin